MQKQPIRDRAPHHGRWQNDARVTRELAHLLVSAEGFPVANYTRVYAGPCYIRRLIGDPACTGSGLSA